VFDPLPSCWQGHLREEFEQPYMESLGAFLEAEQGRGKTVLPAPDQYFAALKATPFERVKGVILGQDPYHGYGQANGLSFSVRKQIALPPSLRNIFKEMAVDLGQPDFQFVDGDLSGLAKQGVLLLNTVLSVEENKPGSHQDCGWENLTDRIICCWMSTGLDWSSSFGVIKPERRPRPLMIINTGLLPLRAHRRYQHIGVFLVPDRSR
jgi:uracil-DNA glycosylase